MVLNFTQDKILVWSKQLCPLHSFFQYLLDNEPCHMPSK